VFTFAEGPCEMTESSLTERMSKVVTSTIVEEWRDEDSVTYKNRASIPSELHGDVFVVFADMGGVCVLDARGRCRAFVHDRREKIELPGWAIGSALRVLDETYPELADLLRTLS
jgi:hypothetical protein